MGFDRAPPLQVGEKVYLIRHGKIAAGPFEVQSERKFKYHRNVRINGEWYSENGSSPSRRGYSERMERDSPDLHQRQAREDLLDVYRGLVAKLDYQYIRIKDADDERLNGAIKAAMALIKVLGIDAATAKG